MSHIEPCVEDNPPPELPTKFPGSLQDEYQRQWKRMGSWIAVGISIGAAISLVTRWYFASLSGHGGLLHFFGISAWLWGAVLAAVMAGYVEVQRSTQIKNRRSRGLCWHCGYEMTNALGGTCPECGATTERPKQKSKLGSHYD